MLAESIATAMLEAAANLQDGSIGIGMLPTFTYLATAISTGRRCSVDRSH